MFSIVIPTRNRAKTLKYALKTACAQDFGDFEVVVADNCSSDDTASVARDVGDNRVRYVKAPEPLAMTNNWEFGITQAKGRYLIVLSDDDALLGDTLSRLNAIIQKENPEVIIWHRARYNWPNCPRPDGKNKLVFSLARYQPRWATSEDILSKALRYVDPNETPGLINSAVHRDVFERLRVKTGRRVLTYSPDTGSGIAIPCVVDRIYMMGEINGIAGISEFSNGAALLTRSDSHGVAREFKALNHKAGGLEDPFMEELGSCSIAATLDSIHDVARQIPGKMDLSQIDMLRVYSQSLVEFDWLSDAALRRELTRKIYRKVLGTHGPLAVADVWLRVIKGRITAVLCRQGWQPIAAFLRAILRKPYGALHFHDGDKHGFSDVAGAAIFLQAELGRLSARDSRVPVPSAR
jgi:glycosyltransferase involved in cell wall biosynthesis